MGKEIKNCKQKTFGNFDEDQKFSSNELELECFSIRSLNH